VYTLQGKIVRKFREHFVLFPNFFLFEKKKKKNGVKIQQISRNNISQFFPVYLFQDMMES